MGVFAGGIIWNRFFKNCIMTSKKFVFCVCGPEVVCPKACTSSIPKARIVKDRKIVLRNILE